METSVAARVVELLKQNHMKITTAESCTGGMVASALVDVPGVSEVFCEGFVTYANDAKAKYLGVSQRTLMTQGAVSEACAYEMAKGVCARTNATVSIVTTGIAGPDGGTETKPVGLVYIACNVCGRVMVRTLQLDGDRTAIRKEATNQALLLALDCLTQVQSSWYNPLSYQRPEYNPAAYAGGDNTQGQSSSNNYGSLYSKDPETIKKNRKKNIIGLVLMMVLICAMVAGFVYSVYDFAKNNISFSHQVIVNGEEVEPDIAKIFGFSDKFNNEGITGGENSQTPGSSEYYEGVADSIDDSLAYSFSFTTDKLDKTGFHNDVNVDVRIPVIAGNVPNADSINKYVKAFVEKERDSLVTKDKNYPKATDGKQIEGYINGYVTYMDASVFSIVFEENINQIYEDRIQVKCINVDANTGMILDNTSMLDVDDNFSVDFRNRSDKQNGKIEMLDYYSDQDITSMFKNEENIIVFYTPLGLEAGLNLDQFGWVTVTYKDYNKIPSSF